MTNLLVVVSRVVGAGQRVGVPVPVHALASVRSLRIPVFQDGFSGSTGFGWLWGGIELLHLLLVVLLVVWVVGDYFSIRSWCFSRRSGSQ